MIPTIEEVKGDVGVIVGRFQVHQLHPGHIELLEFVRSRHQKFVVMLGCTDLGWSARNPLDFEARMRMIHEHFPEAIVLPLYDKPTDREWSRQLDERLQETLSPGQKPVLYGSRDSFIPHYEGRFSTQELAASETIWSGSQVREQLRVAQVPNGDFRSGVIWRALNEYPRVVMCVDIACFHDSTYKQMIVIKKDRQYQFPGGFCEPGGTFESDARRELYEEAVGGETDDFHYLGHFNIDDSRFRGEPHKMRTMLFRAVRIFGPVRAGDDAKGAKLLDMPLRIDDFIPEHRPLAERVNEWWKENKAP